MRWEPYFGTSGRLKQKCYLFFQGQQKGYLRSCRAGEQSPFAWTKGVLQSQRKTRLQYQSEICVAKGPRLFSLIFGFGFLFFLHNPLLFKEDLKFWDILWKFSIFPETFFLMQVRFISQTQGWFNVRNSENYFPYISSIQYMITPKNEERHSRLLVFDMAN